MTSAPVEKLVPEIVTRVPPTAGPEMGRTVLIAPATMPNVSALAHVYAPNVRILKVNNTGLIEVVFPRLVDMMDTATSVAT